MKNYITNVVVGALMLGLTSGALAAEKDKGGNSGGISALELRITELEAANDDLQSIVFDLLNQFASHVGDLEIHHDAYTDAEAIAAVDPTNVLDVLWRQGSEVYFEGINLHVNNGRSSTGGAGLGNLIIGFNLERQPGTGPDGLGRNERTGTHTLVLGNFNNYTSSGGFVAGAYNEVNGPYSTITGGGFNISSGYVSAISGGGNIATQSHSSVTGGLNNEASALYATVSGGSSNVANGFSSSVSGGVQNAASGPNASISGGFNTIETDGNAHPDTHN